MERDERLTRLGTLREAKAEGFAEGEANANKKFATRMEKMAKFLQSKGVPAKLLTAALAIK